ncbi:MAG: sodium/solute symporter, partial [Planctomycetes bacterium]|nr:sodium/solute symporter [Planctomycetota bacterium]
YMIGVFVIAIVAHRYLKRGSEFETEYYVGGRNFGAWVLAMSWVATLASGGTFLGYPSRIYTYGWSMAFWVSGSTVTAIVGLGIVGKRINRLARQTGALTLVDILRDRFKTETAGVIYAVVIIVVTSVYLIAQFAAGARILESMLGTSYPMGMLLFTVSVVAYTTYGGFRAVAWTDTLQGIVMLIGIVLLVPLAIHAVGGLEKAIFTGERPLAERVDPAAELKGVPTEKHAYLYLPGPQKFPPKEDQHTPEPWLPLGMGISFFMLRSLGSIMMPTTVPRMLAFKDTRALRRALLILGPYFLLMYGSSMITMNCAHSLGLGLSPEQADTVVPELAQRVAPPILAGLFIAAPFAAVMSTVDSALLVISASVVRDLVQKTWYPQMTEKTTMRLSYVVTAGAGALVFLMALFVKPTFLQPLVIHYVGSAASALCWPGLATLYWSRATGKGVTAGLVGGAAVYLLCVFVKPFEETFPMHPFVYGFIASALTTCIVSLLTPAQEKSQQELYFGRE